MLILSGLNRPVPALFEKRLGVDFDYGSSIGTTGSGVAFAVTGHDPSAAHGHSSVTVRYRGGHIPIILGLKE